VGPESKDSFLKVARLHDLRPDSGTEVVVGDRTVALWRAAGVVYATSARCPHRGAPLVSGHLDGCVVICPMHGWAFDVADGRSAEGADIERYEVRIEDGEVLVRIPTPPARR
jgi:nitrite reductase/ring-hydroxylating ferredoxin subunit